MKEFKQYIVLGFHLLLFAGNIFAQCNCNPNSCSLTANISYQGTSAQGDYSVFLAPSSNGVLINPFIIVEGLDLTNTFGCAQFNASGIADGLNEAGFDVVFLNFANNTDFIERNAFLVVALIQQINNIKTGNNKLIVSGINTGAVVARYALTYMEANQLDHQTKCYISYDGPQSGLNIPIGLQVWMNAVQGDPILLIQGAQNLLGEISNPMLGQLEYISGPFTTAQQNGGPLIPDPLFTSFFTELRGLNSCYGYPEKCEKIAISLGDINRTTQLNNDGVTPAISGNAFFSYSYNPSIDNLPVNPGVLGATSGWIGSIIDENLATDFPTGTFPATCAHFDFDFSFSWAPSGVVISQLKPYDICPGSYNSDLIGLCYYNVQQFLEPQYVTPIFFQATFVPTISAFDINTSDFYFDFSAHLPIESVSPFDKCYSVGYNDYYADVNFYLPSAILTDITNSNTYVECTQIDAVVPSTNVASGQSDTWRVSQNLKVNNYILNNGATSSLIAGSNILLGPGFNALNGSNADLTIEPCNYNVCTPPSFIKPPDGGQLIATSITQNTDIFNLKIYPNPASTTLQINVTSANYKSALIRITNESGILYNQLQANQATLEINIANLVPGVYFLTYINSDQNVTKMFTVVR